MVFKKEKQAPVLFAERILIISTSLSNEAKDVLKEKNIENLLQFSCMPKQEVMKFICKKKAQKEIRDFHNELTFHLAKEKVAVRFSKNIPPPKKSATREEERTLIALLIFETFFGDKRQARKVKHVYLPHLYASTNDRNPRRANQTKFFRMQYFSAAS